MICRSLVLGKMSLCISMYPSLYLCIFVPISESLPLCISMNPSLYLCFFVLISESLSLCISMYLSLCPPRLTDIRKVP